MNSTEIAKLIDEYLAKHRLPRTVFNVMMALNDLGLIDYVEEGEASK